MEFLRRLDTPGIPEGFSGIPHVPFFSCFSARSSGTYVPAPVPENPCSGQEHFGCAGTSKIVPVEFLETLTGIPVQEFLELLINTMTNYKQ